MTNLILILTKIFVGIIISCVLSMGPETEVHSSKIPALIDSESEGEGGLFAYITCPSDSLGSFPNCECMESEKVFSVYIKECYVPCGDNTAGIHPECRCEDDLLYYDIDLKKCKSSIGRKCPENSIGIGPDCLCMDENHVFHISQWECDFEYFGMPPTADWICPVDYSQKWPQCDFYIGESLLISLLG